MRWLLALMLALAACEDDSHVAASAHGMVVDAVEVSDTSSPDGGHHDGDPSPGSDLGTEDGGPNDGLDTDEDADVTEADPNIRRVNLSVNQMNWEALHQDPKADVEVPCTVSVDGGPALLADLELHGGYARKFEKKSYRVHVRGDEPEWDLFGDGPEIQERFVLQASWIDPTFLRNELTMWLDRQVSVLAPRLSFAEVTVNGEYHGFYLVIERIDERWLVRHGLSVDAHLYKAESHWANFAAKADPLKGYDVQLGDAADVSDLAALLRILTDTAATHDAFQAAVAPVFALDDFMAWQRVHSFAADQDTFDKNYYLHHPVGATPGSAVDIFRIIAWDADATWGNNWDGKALDPTQETWHGVDKLSPRLLGIPEYRQSYLDAYSAALDGPFSVEALKAHVNEKAAIIKTAVQRDLDAWERDDVDFDAEIARLLGAIDSRWTTMRAVVDELLGE